MRGFITTMCLICLFAASVPAADAMKFRKVDYFEGIPHFHFENAAATIC